jgi:SPP1 gp7 family putative phage head morphogenesis protein
MAETNFVNMLKRMWTKAPDRKTAGVPELYHTNPRLDPVRVIAKAAASTEYRLYSKKDIRKNGRKNAEGIEEHELYSLLENPCPTFNELDGWALRYLTFAHIRLVGEFFWLKVRATNGKIIALLPVPAAWVPRKPTAGIHTFLVYPYGVTASQALTVPADDVVWFKDPNLNDPYGNGRGSTEAIIDEAETDEHAAKFQKDFFFNQATPPYAIIMEGGNDQTVKQMKTGFMQKLSGWMHAKEPMVLAGKGITIQPLSQNMLEIDMIETRKFLRDQTLQHYQIPPEIYGIVENSNRATIDAAFFLFNKNVLSYDLCFFERTITNQLCRVDFDEDLVLRHDEIIQEDEEFALKVYESGIKNMLITREEWRARFKFTTVPEDGTYIAPFSLLEVPAVKIKDETVLTSDVQASALNGAQLASIMAVAQSVADGLLPLQTAIELVIVALPTLSRESATLMLSPAENFKDPKEEVLEIEEDKPEESVLEVEDTSAEKDYLVITKSDDEIENRKVAIWKSFDAKATGKENGFKKSVHKFSAVQREKTKDAIKAEIKKSVDMDAINAAISKTFGDSADVAVKRALAPAWIESMETGRDHALELLGMEKAYTAKADSTVTNAWFNKWVDAAGLKKAVQINKTTTEELERVLGPVLKASIERGDSIGNTVKALMEVADDIFDTLDKSRAELIARTESASSMGFGSFATYKIEGVEKKEFLATRDERTRESHAEADGQIVGIDEKFNVGGEMMDFPGDPEASAKNVCNCRCTFLPVVEAES